jgi:hypothetical protein
VRGQRHAPASLYPRERPGTHCTGGWVGPRAGLNRCGKSRPPPGFDSRSVQPCSPSLYRLSYRVDSFVFAFHCNYQKPFRIFVITCQSRLRCLRVLQTTKLTHSSELATLNARTRKVSRVSAQGAQIPGSRSLRRMNFVSWRLITVGPQFGPCFLSPLWLQERCGGTQIVWKIDATMFQIAFPPRRPCVLHAVCVCPSVYFSQFSFNQLSDFD